MIEIILPILVVKKLAIPIAIAIFLVFNDDPPQKGPGIPPGKDKGNPSINN
ncbi:MAG: hypothetical protein INQ03_12505 [Candidatus Heimdallarchaeota archaeon]|nr:hypothetical protein [Candidatus Heimdallarchaeota archaeon]